MAVSRIAFALGDLVAEVGRLSPDGPERPGFGIELRLDPETFAAVERELVHHFGGGRLREDKRADDGLRGIARCVRIGGLRLVSVLPGKWSI